VKVLLFQRALIAFYEKSSSNRRSMRFSYYILRADMRSALFEGVGRGAKLTRLLLVSFANSAGRASVAILEM
jgi:hypothetical protein